MQDFTSPIVTVDGLIFRFVGEKLHVLLVKRQQAPFKGSWALPGGYMSAHETSTGALKRVLKEKADTNENSLRHIEQLYTFDTPAVRGGNAISIVYIALSNDERVVTTGELQKFFPIMALPELAYEHERLVHFAHERLKNKIMYTNILFALLPSKFTLTQLQTAYETILSKKFDKRNFRKRFLQLDLIKETDNYNKGGAHRPARLYAFTEQKLQSLSRSFE